MLSKRLVVAALASCLTLGGVGIPAQALAAGTSKTASNKAVEPTKAPDYKYTLKEAGSFEANKNEITFSRRAAIKKDGDKYYLVGPDGKSILGDKDITWAEYVTDDLYLVRVENGDVNNMGIVNSKGKVLLDFEAAQISNVTTKAADARFLKVVYTTGETDDEDECFIFSTDRAVGLTPDEDDTMYKGYAEVFSIDKGKMVKGVRITNPAIGAMKDLGDSFTVDQDDTLTMYDASGKKLYEGPRSTRVYSSGLVSEDHATYKIIDTKGKVCFESEPKQQIYGLDGTDGYFRMLDDSDKWVAIDSKGNQVNQGSYDAIGYAGGGLLYVENGSKDQLVDGSGKVLLKDVSDVRGEPMLGYMVASTDDEYVILKAGKEIASSEDRLDSDDLLVEDEDNEDTYLVLNDEEFSLRIFNTNVLGVGLVRASRPAHARDYTYGVYDLFTGEELLEDKYEKIDVAGGYLYANDEGTWTVFEIELDEA